MQLLLISIFKFTYAILAIKSGSNELIIFSHLVQLPGKIIICPHSLFANRVQCIDFTFNLAAFIVLCLSDPPQSGCFSLFQLCLSVYFQLSKLQLVYAGLSLVHLKTLVSSSLLDILGKSLLTLILPFKVLVAKFLGIKFLLEVGQVNLGFFDVTVQLLFSSYSLNLINKQRNSYLFNIDPEFLVFNLQSLYIITHFYSFTLSRAQSLFDSLNFIRELPSLVSKLQTVLSDKVAFSVRVLNIQLQRI